MASSLLQQVQERQASLVEALIDRIFQFQPGDPNLATVRNYCAQHLNPKHHSFQAAHSGKVNELYAGLEERLVEHAQYSKAHALHMKRHQLLQLGLQGLEPDLDWSILSLLFNLSNRPLDTHYTPPHSHSDARTGKQHTYDRRAGNQAPVQQGLPAAAADNSDSNCAVGTSEDDADNQAWDASSELSDWSQEEAGSADVDFRAVYDSVATAAGVVSGQHAAGAGSDGALTNRDASTAAGGLVAPLGATASSRMAAAAMAELDDSIDTAPCSVGPARITSCPPDSLASCLANARTGYLPLAGLPAEFCCSDGYLVHQALSLMLGSESQAFAWQERLGRYQPRKGLYVPDLSASQLQAVLGKFAETGSQVRHLKTLTSLSPDQTLLQLPATMGPVGFHSPRLAGPKAVLATPCLRAYLEAMHGQLQRLTQSLVALQQGSMAAAAAASVGAETGGRCALDASRQQRPLNLLELLDLASPAMRRIQLLYLSALAVMAALPGVPAVDDRSPRLRTGTASAGGAQDSSAAAAAATAKPSPKAAGASSTASARTGTRRATTSDVGALEQMYNFAGAAGSAGRPPMVPSLRLDSAIAQTALSADPTSSSGGVSAAQCSTVLLDVLHRQLQQFGPLGSPSHCSDHQVLLHLFLCALVPVLEALQCWLCDSDGPADNLPQDFFVKVSDRSVPETDPAFWSSAFVLVQQEVPQQGASNQTGNPDLLQDGQQNRAEQASAAGFTAGVATPTKSLACPSFLLPLADRILAAGKSLRLLTSSERQGINKRTATGRPGAGATVQGPTEDSSTAHTVAARDRALNRHAGYQGGNRQQHIAGSSSRTLLQGFLTSVAEYTRACSLSSVTAGMRLKPSSDGNIASLDQCAPSVAGAAALPAQAANLGVAPQLKAGPDTSFFALMAAAGRSMGRLEPWLDTPGLPTTRLPPPPATPWLPPWAPPSELLGGQPTVDDLHNRTRRVPSAAGEVNVCSPAGAGRPDSCTVAAPCTPSHQAQQGLAAAHPAAMGLPTTPGSPTAPLAAMDVSAPSTPLLEPPGITASSQQQQQQRDELLLAESGQQRDTGTASQPSASLHPGTAVMKPEQPVFAGWAGLTDGRGLHVAGLEAWHGEVIQGMSRWQGRLQQQQHSAPVVKGRQTQGGAELDQLRASLLPTSWCQGRTFGQHWQEQRQQPQSSSQHHQGQQGCETAAVGVDSWGGTAASGLQLAMQRLAWLLEGCSDAQQLPPIDMLLQRCLLPLVQDRIDDINQQLLACMLSDWGLMAELVQLRNFYLLGSPVMQAWANWLLSSLLRGKMLEEYQEYEVEVALQEAMSSWAEGDAPLPPLECVSVTIDHKRAARARDRQVEATRKTAAAFATAPQSHSGGGAHPSERKQNHCLAELDGLQLRCQPTWLMAMIGGSPAMDSYGQVMVFMLQIQLAKLALENTRQRSWKLLQRQLQRRAQGIKAAITSRTGVAAGSGGSLGVMDIMYGPAAASTGRSGQRSGTDGGAGGPLAGVAGGNVALLDQKAEEAAQQEMVNFVNNLHQFVMDRLLLNAWVQMERALDSARSLDEVVAIHKQFLTELDQQCGRGGAAGGTQKHVWAAIIRVLDQAVRFCSAHKNAAEAAEALSESSSVKGDGSSVPGTSSTQRRGGLMTRSQLQLQEQLGTARKVMADAAAQFSQLLLYLLRILHAATLKARSRTEFEQLLTRINHNEYYDKMIMLTE